MTQFEIIQSAVLSAIGKCSISPSLKFTFFAARLDAFCLALKTTDIVGIR